MLHQLAPEEGRRASLEEYIDAVRRRKATILIACLLGLLVAYLFQSTSVPTFTGTARVVVSPTPVGSVNANLTKPNLDREVEVIVSDPIASDAVALMGVPDQDPLLLRRQIEAQFEPGSDVVRVSYTSEIAEEAALIPNAFVAAYVTSRLEEQANYYDSLAAVLELTRSSADQDIADATAELGQLDAARTAAVALPTDDPARLPEIARLDSLRTSVTHARNLSQTERRTAQSQLNTLRAEQTSQIPAASTLRLAATPSVSNSAKPLFIYLVGLVMGLGIGLVTAFVSVRLDRTAGAERDVELALETSVLGKIPDLGWRARIEGRVLTMMGQSKSVRHQLSREAFRRLRTTLQYLMVSQDLRCVLFTSSTSGEGKSVTAANLAIALADAGKSVALINADMRRPSTEELFGISNSDGLSNFIGGISEELFFVRIDGYDDRLIVVPAGPAPANPSELLASAKFVELVHTIRDSVDFVIIDTPPVNATADALAATNAVDGAIVVVDGRTTSVPELLSVKRHLNNAGLTIVGAVLNRDRSDISRGWRGRRNRYAYATSSQTLPTDLSLRRPDSAVDGADDEDTRVVKS